MAFLAGLAKQHSVSNVHLYSYDEVNVDGTNYMVLSRDPDAVPSHIIKTDNSSCERVQEFKYLGIALTYKNSFQEDIKSRPKSGNACCLSVQNLWFSSLLSKNLKIKIYRAIILPFVLYECETWSLILRKERRPRVFENKVPRRICGPRRDEVTGSGENYIMMPLMNCTPHPILFG